MANAVASQTMYRLEFDRDAKSTARVLVTPEKAVAPDSNLVMPRSVPGEYAISRFDSFLEDVTAVTTDGTRLALKKNDFDAPRWSAVDNKKPIARFEYRVDLERMERRMPPGSASIAREEFAGFLNYSIFAWIDGLEEKPVRCEIATAPEWPIFSTNAPSAAPRKGIFSFVTPTYFDLADGQIFVGPRFQVAEFNGPVPLFVVSYYQSGKEHLEDYGRQGVRSLEILKDYFGELPFKHYSLMYLHAVPLESGTAPQLAMEHLASSTFFGDTEGVRVSPISDEERARTISPILHHMAHAFVPLRSYGDAYRPRVMEIPPVIRNIWFNEGFMWFLVYDTLKAERLRAVFDLGAIKTADAIKRLSLEDLSLIGSTSYGIDFRLGRALYSRGALMALEMDDLLKTKSRGRKSMCDVIRYLYQWSRTNKRAFTMSEFPMLIDRAAGIEISPIYRKWQAPVVR